jgi:hypothetical protein
MRRTQSNVRLSPHSDMADLAIILLILDPSNRELALCLIWINSSLTVAPQ